MKQQVFPFISPRLQKAASLILFLATIACSGAATVRIESAGRSIDLYDVLELTLHVSPPPAGNPFTEVRVTGEFVPEGGSTILVEGFCDSEDGSVHRLRFMPTRAGPHSYSILYRHGDTEERLTGRFTARAGSRPGPVRVNPGFPTQFRREGSDQPFFYNSTTTYWLLGVRDDRDVRESLDRLARLQVNRIRVALSGRTTSGMRWKEPMIVSNDGFQFRLEPWPAARPLDITNPGYDVSRFNLEHFRKADRMLAHARSRDIQVSLIFALDVADAGVDPFGKTGMGGPDEQRYYRYCVARFAAHANVWWDLINEWNLCRPESWVRQMGALVKKWDPYDHLTSVHGTARFPFGNEPWVDYVMFQSWDEHGAYDFLLQKRSDQIATGRPLPIVNEEYGYEDHYPFPWGEKRIWPARIAEDRLRLAWEMSMAGAHQTTGERANIANEGGWITGRGNNQMVMLDGYARMRRFFESVDWWKLEPHPELVRGESKALPVREGGSPMAAALCLAAPGETYVIYLRAGGTASLDLPAGRFEVERFNPRTGKTEKFPSMTGGGSWSSPALPDTEPWVFVVRRS